MGLCSPGVRAVAVQFAFNVCSGFSFGGGAAAHSNRSVKGHYMVSITVSTWVLGSARLAPGLLVSMRSFQPPTPRCNGCGVAVSRPVVRRRCGWRWGPKTSRAAPASPPDVTCQVGGRHRPAVSSMNRPLAALGPCRVAAAGLCGQERLWGGVVTLATTETADAVFPPPQHRGPLQPSLPTTLTATPQPYCFSHLCVPPLPSPVLPAGKEGKQVGVSMEAGAFVAHVQGLLDQIQEGLTAQATAFRDANIVDVRSYDELKEAIAAGGYGQGARAAERVRAGRPCGWAAPYSRGLLESRKRRREGEVWLNARGS
jgi:hypothetical protein